MQYQQSKEDFQNECTKELICNIVITHYNNPNKPDLPQAIFQPQKLKSVAQKILLQMNSKLGGEL
ncbi:hypothetical protein NQZ68_026425 [Dissostichus eleginoides]|nr:hypothetical protein NQZ68_026425 [Dissostichus eleginoides]